MSLVDDAIAAAKRAGIDPTIFVRQINQESGFNPNAVSPAGAIGIAQFEPGTAAGMGVNPWNPQSALEGAARLDAANLKAYGGDWAKALAAYNAGGGAVNEAIKRGGKNWRNFLPSETQNYIRIILGGKGPPPAAPPVASPTGTPSTHTPSQPVSHTHPAGTPDVSHVDAFGQPYALSVPSQQTPVRPQPLFLPPQAFSVPRQPSTPVQKPRTIFGIPVAFSVPRQPSTPVQKPKPTRPQAAPKPAPAQRSATQKKTQQAGKRVVGGPS